MLGFLTYFGLFATAALAAPTAGVEVTLSNARRFKFDVDGNHIANYNGHISYIDNQYFWVGNQRGCGRPLCDVLSWSSPDLKYWSPNGPLFNISDPVNTAACSAGFGSCDRLKVAYNPTTSKYVAYAFSGNPGQPGPVVFVSDSLRSGYSFVGRANLGGLEPGDIVEDLAIKVINSTGYVVYTKFNLPNTIAGRFSNIWPPFINPVLIQELTPDFLNATGEAYPVVEGAYPITSNSTNLVEGQVQAPDLFKRGDTFYMVGSGTCSFCNGTTTIAYRSKAISGPWTLQVVQSELTCGGQALGVATIPSTTGGESTYLYHSDAFSTAPNGLVYIMAHGHDWFKLEFNDDGSIQPLDCSRSASTTITVPYGSTTGLRLTGAATNATDGSGEFADYVADNHLPATQFYQTWTSSKTGSLVEVGVNLAANNPSNNMSITVFRYTNDSDFVKPFFFWEQLASVEVGLVVPVQESFGVVKVPVPSVSVQRGDKLGFALVGPRAGANTAIPYGYLVADTTGSANPDHNLFVLTRGHVSENDDGSSPVKVWENRELKWYASVV